MIFPGSDPDKLIKCGQNMFFINKYKLFYKIPHKTCITDHLQYGTNKYINMHNLPRSLRHHFIIGNCDAARADVSNVLNVWILAPFSGRTANTCRPVPDASTSPDANSMTSSSRRRWPSRSRRRCSFHLKQHRLVKRINWVGGESPLNKLAGA